MPRQDLAYLALNRGLASKLALARADVKRLTLSAEIMENWMAQVLGPMSLRVGTQFLDGILNDSPERFIPFEFSVTDTALLEITDKALRVWVDDVVITRPAVQTQIVNSTFDVDLSGWTDSDQSAGNSSWIGNPVGEPVGGYMQLFSTNGIDYARRDQKVTLGAMSSGVQHALHIIVTRGPVVLRVGTTQGDDDVFNESTLDTGAHSLAFTPTTDFWIRLEGNTQQIALINQCSIEAAGDMVVEAPWAAADLSKIRAGDFLQSADVVFAACAGYRQYRIERRSVHSWSVVQYKSPDGPFRIQNVTPITLQGDDLTGNIGVTASDTIFRAGHVGALFSLTALGQNVSQQATGANEFTGSIRVTGVGDARSFQLIISNTFSATVTLQQSFDSGTGPWTDYQTYTTPQTISVLDTLDNQIVWYRLGVKSGDFTSGEADLKLQTSSGTTRGIVRMTSYISATQMTAEVLSALGSTDATDTWEEGKWSDYRGWPTSGCFHEGRLWWFGQNGIDGSVSDAFDSFDETTLGDSGPISRSIGSGPVDTMNWGLSLSRLLLGGEGAEFSCRSSSLDEPLTPTDFNIKAPTTQGSAPVQAVKIDSSAIMIQRGGTRVFEVAFDVQTYDFGSSHVTALCPEAGKPGIVRVAVARQPDTRIHCVRSDGKVLIIVKDKIEDVICLQLWSTDGVVEDVVVLPSLAGESDDRVYYVINRTINGVTKRYLEKWAQESDCIGGTLNMQADAFVTYSGPATNVMQNLGHLEGKTVVIWGDGKYLGTATVIGAQAIIPNGKTCANGISGLGYTAQWKSGKLVQIQTSIGIGLNMRKTIKGLGFILANTHAQGIQYGPEFDHLDDLPMIESGAPVDQDSVSDTYDQDVIEFPSQWSTDARICLQANAPKPCTVMSVVYQTEGYS